MAKLNSRTLNCGRNRVVPKPLDIVLSSSVIDGEQTAPLLHAERLVRGNAEPVRFYLRIEAIEVDVCNDACVRRHVLDVRIQLQLRMGLSATKRFHSGIWCGDRKSAFAGIAGSIADAKIQTVVVQTTRKAFLLHK